MERSWRRPGRKGRIKHLEGKGREHLKDMHAGWGQRRSHPEGFGADPVLKARVIFRNKIISRHKNMLGIREFLGRR